jgi:hypothetical protein
MSNNLDIKNDCPQLESTNKNQPTRVNFFQNICGQNTRVRALLNNIYSFFRSNDLFDILNIILMTIISYLMKLVSYLMKIISCCVVAWKKIYSFFVIQLSVIRLSLVKINTKIDLKNRLNVKNLFSLMTYSSIVFELYFMIFLKLKAKYWFIFNFCCNVVNLYKKLDVDQSVKREFKINEIRFEWMEILSILSGTTIILFYNIGIFGTILMLIVMNRTLKNIIEH